MIDQLENFECFEREFERSRSSFVALSTAGFPALLDDNFRPSTFHTIASIAPHQPLAHLWHWWRILLIAWSEMSVEVNVLQHYNNGQAVSVRAPQLRKANSGLDLNNLLTVSCIQLA
jgi:hypothetical protein